MARHTPGPWVYSLRSDFAEIGQPGGLTVAHLNLRLLDINTSVADASLIAAAPDLLAACEEWLEADGPHVSLAEQRRMARMRAAVAKAKGGA